VFETDPSHGELELHDPCDLNNDRRNIVLKIKECLRKLGLQATKVQKRSLYSIMQQRLPPIDAATEAELADLEQLFHKDTR